MVGNRPQFIKSAALSLALRAAGVDEVVLHTGQHWDPEMSQVFFDELGLPEPAHRLDLRTADPRAMTLPIREAIEAERPDWVLVYGDTNSTLAGAHAAGEEVAVAHVEAGLRSFDLSMPEERNRIEVDRLSALLLCPDERSAAQLEAEGVPGRREVVGDVMGDATRLFEPAARRLDLPFAPPYTVLTIHRQANTEPGRLREIVEAVTAAERRFVFPVHPRTRHVLDEHGLLLAANVEAVEPLGYLEMLALVAGARGGRHRLRRAPEGGVLAGRPVRDATAEHRVGRHSERRREPACRARRARRRPRDGPVSGRRPAALRRRSRLGTHRSRPVRLSAVPESPLYDVAVIGAGYVGLPLAATFAEGGSRVLVIEVQPWIVEALNGGTSHIEDVTSDRLAPLVEKGLVVASSDYEQVKNAHAVLIALPTPLSRQREPDLSYIERAAQSLAPVLQRGQVVVLESTTWPGTTREILQPILEQGSGLKAGVDFHLAMSPERVDPGREDWTTKTTPKVVGGITPASTTAAAEVYRSALDTVHEVSTPDAAELTKLLENIYRAVNIALVNELAQLCDRMEIDVWEVIEAAATKPFGFASFKPGPGLGGHCIPIDPFYLTWKAREFDFSTRFIELAGEVNNNMPYFCRSLVSQALNHGAGKSVERLEDPDRRRRLQARHRRLARDAGREADPSAAHRRRRRQLSRSLRPRVRRHDVGRARSRGLRLHRDRDQPFPDRLRRPRAPREGDRRLPQRHQGARGRRQGLEALDGVGRRRGPQLLGPESRPQLRATSPIWRGSATSTSSTSNEAPSGIRTRGRRRSTAICSPTTRSTRS